MDVVFDGIDENGCGTKVLENRGHVGVEVRANVVGDKGFSVLGAKNQVDV